MKINITVEEYFEEISLMKKQNQTEYDVYHLIYLLMQNSLNNKSYLTFRDVHKRQKSKKGQIFYGVSSFPDFVIVDKEFDDSKTKEDENTKKQIINMDNKVLLYGAVEVKNPWKCPELNIEEIIKKLKKGETLSYLEGQFLGELLWYKKILYTDGLCWKFLEWKPNEIDDYKKICDIVNLRLEYEAESEKKESFIWYNELKNDFGKKDWSRGISIKCIADLTKDYEEYNPNGDNKKLFERLTDEKGQWTNLTKELKGIDWRESPTVKITNTEKEKG